MKIREIIELLNFWAPQKSALGYDNVGLQVGNSNSELKNILLCLEVSPEIIKEAKDKRCNLIITHHPLIFSPINSIRPDTDDLSKLLELLIKNNIAVFSMHTNLDSAKDGVSFELAKQLELKNIKFLQKQSSNQVKLIVFVPENSIEKVSSAIFKAGAGVIGDYDKCSFRINGVGTFQGNEGTNPTIGKKHIFEKVNEVRLEVILDNWNIDNVISEMLKVHPYEEPAYDIYSLNNENSNYGLGAIGLYEKGKNIKEFLSLISKKLKLKSFRYCKGKLDKIKLVAVCGGSGSELLSKAINLNADAFVTADIKYNRFRDADGKILLVDGGHFETEIFAVDILYKKINSIIAHKKNRIKTFKAKTNTNPIKIFT